MRVIDLINKLEELDSESIVVIADNDTGRWLNIEDIDVYNDSIVIYGDYENIYEK